MSEAVSHFEPHEHDSRPVPMEVVDSLEDIGNIRTQASTLFHAAMRGERFKAWDVATDRQLGVVYFQSRRGGDSSVITIGYWDAHSTVLLNHELIRQTEAGKVTSTQNRTLTPAGSEQYGFKVFTPKLGQRRFFSEDDLLPQPTDPYTLEMWGRGLREIAEGLGQA